MSRDDTEGHITSDITQITVVGGVTRMDADTADMARAAGLVATAARHLASARQRCLQAVTRIEHIEMLRILGWGSMGDEPPNAAAVLHLSQAQSSVTLAASALALQMTNLEQLSASTFGAADTYADAESTAAARMLDIRGGVASWFVFSPFGAATTFAFGTAQSAGTSWRDRALGGTGAVLGSANPFRDPFSTPGVDDAAVLVGGGYRLFSRATDPLSLMIKRHNGYPLVPKPTLDYRAGHLVETTTTVAPITSALDAADAIDDLPDHSVSVLHTKHPGGTDTWAVFVRGTDDWSPGTDSPFSGEANFDLMSGQESDSVTLVESALRQAGAPVGAAVGLYGHSQGGIVAMRLSDDPVFRRRYDLRSVTTFGSPTGTLTQSAPVPTLHVENNQEWVSSTDASVSPGTAARVTISADLPDGYPGSAHGMRTHRAVLDAAIRQGEPAVLHAVEQQQAVLGGPAYAGSTTIPLPDVEITVFSPGPPPAAQPPPMCTGAPPTLVSRVPADVWAPPEPPRTADGGIDWNEATRRARPSLALVQAGGR